MRHRSRKYKKVRIAKRIPRRVSGQLKKPQKRQLSQHVRKQYLLEKTAISYNQGFDAGYNNALNKLVREEPSNAIERDCEKEYKTGLYDGGDAIVDSLLSDEEILPNISIRQIIEAGVEQMRPQMCKPLNAAEVAEQILNAMNTNTPLSLVRLGDGELLALSQEVVLSGEQVRKEGHFLRYAGVELPDLIARDRLAQAVRNATIVGIPKLRLANFQPFAFTVLKAHGIDYRQLRMTLSTINYTLYLEGYLSSILVNRRVLTVGNMAKALSEVLI